MKHPVLYSGLSNFHFTLFEALKDLRNKIPDELRGILSFSPPFVSRPVLNKFGWLVLPNNPAEFNIPKLVLFHYLMEQHGYIICAYEEFELRFMGDKKLPREKIVWAGDVMVLVLLFDVLMNDKKVIPPINNLYDMLCEHFELLDKKKNTIKPLSRGSLKSSLTNAKSNSTVQNIVKNLLLLLLS